MNFSELSLENQMKIIRINSKEKMKGLNMPNRSEFGMKLIYFPFVNICYRDN